MSSEGGDESELAQHDDDRQNKDLGNERGWWEENSDSNAFDIDGDVDENHVEDVGDEEDVQDEVEDQMPDATVRAVSVSASPRQHQQECRSALLVIQHADKHLNHLDALFAPLMTVSSSPSSTKAGLFSRVEILDIRGNALNDLAPLLLIAPSLRMLNAAENTVVSLPPRSFWSQFARLELCFLADNLLGPWTNGTQDDNWLDALAGATALRWLTLAGNPVMSRPRARTAVVNKLHQLRALDDLVVADSERVQFARGTSRYPIGLSDERRLGIEMPRVLADDGQALRFVELARREVNNRHARNSACVAIQRVLRGFLSRNYRHRRGRICGLWTLRTLVTRVQAAARGFLFRRLIQRELAALVVAQGEEALLDLDPSQSLHVPLSARRGLQRLRVLVQSWRRQFRERKRAAAVAKIRVWCRMVRQRNHHRAEQLIRDRQELIIYFDEDDLGRNEERVLALASWAARRDPFLTQLPVPEREELLRARCSISSGVRVLRSVVYATQLSIVPPVIGAFDAGYGSRNAFETLVRLFPSDTARETQVLIAQKRLLQSDLDRVRSALGVTDEGNSATSVSPLPPMSRAVTVHLKQMEREIETRLAVCNKKILSACVKAQARKQCTVTRRLSLVKRSTKLRPRGYTLSRRERRKISGMSRSRDDSCADDKRRNQDYRALRAFIPWSVDMYLLVLAGLSNQPQQTSKDSKASNRRESRASIPGIHRRKPEFLALSYEQTRRMSAALSIQSAWRATQGYSKRLALEATIARARLCLQRWWRVRSGLHRRLAFLRACVLVGSSINSRTLFIEARVFYALRDRARWEKIQNAMFRRWPEHSLPCHINSRGRAVIAVASPVLCVLRSAGQEGISLARGLSVLAHNSAASGIVATSRSTMAQMESLAAQRCSSVLPAWLPGAPEHEEATMGSRSGGDATPSLLSEGVQTEPTLLEREMMLHGQHSPIADVFAQTNPFRCMATGHKVAEAATQLMTLVHDQASLNVQASRGESPSRRQPGLSLVGLETTSLVRLQFESVDEARRRAILLVAKTFDPVSNTFVQLHSLEALVGAALRHHQWSLCQLPNAGDALATLDRAQQWLNARFPSPWWASVERRLLKMGMPANAVAELMSIPASAPPASRPPINRHIASATSPTESSAAARYRGRRSSAAPTKVSSTCQLSVGEATLTEPAGPMRVRVSITPLDAQTETDIAVPSVPRPPASPASSSPRSLLSDQAGCSLSPPGSSRHQLLANRLGQSKAYELISELRHEQLEQRMYHVRDLREERERAMEALIVDRRLQQRESAAEVAGVKLDIDVRLVKLRYERELDRLSLRECIESEKLAAKRSKLTHVFERQFAAQSGALMRRAARDAVARSRQAQHAARLERAKEVRERDTEELTHRQDAKSWWFVNNQRARRERGAQQHADAVQVANSERVRLANTRQRIQEDKEIKSLLRIM